MTVVGQKIVLIACCAKKLEHPAPAYLLYASPLFRLSYRYAGSLAPDTILILSAKHGLVAPEATIAPYDESLAVMGARLRAAWSNRVVAQLRAVADLDQDEFVFLAGTRYRRGLAGYVAHSTVPLAGLGIGRQLQFLNRAAVAPRSAISVAGVLVEPGK